MHQEISLRDLIAKVDEQKNARRGLLVDERLKVDGTDNIFALGDCTLPNTHQLHKLPSKKVNI